MGTLPRKQRWREEPEVPAIGTTGAAGYGPTHTSPERTVSLLPPPFHLSHTRPTPSQLHSSQVLKFRCSGQSRSPLHLHLHPSQFRSSEVPTFRSPQVGTTPPPPLSSLFLLLLYFFKLKNKKKQWNYGTPPRKHRVGGIRHRNATGTSERRALPR